MAKRPHKPYTSTHSLWYPACSWTIELAIPGSPSSFKHIILAITDVYVYKAISPAYSTIASSIIPCAAIRIIFRPLRKPQEAWIYLRWPCRGLLKAGVSRRALPGACETASRRGNPCVQSSYRHPKGNPSYEESRYFLVSARLSMDFLGFPGFRV